VASGSSIRIGKVEVADFTDAGGPFPPPISQLFPGVSAEQWQPWRQRFPEAFAGEEHANVHFGSYLIRSEGQTVLVDTGIGPTPPAMFGEMRGRLLDNLRSAGVQPDAIDTVFTTHAHIDHVGWNLTADGKPVFPRARYLMHQADYDALPAFEEALGPYADATIRPLKDLGLLDLLTGERALTGEVTAIPTPGHTPGHMSLLIASSGEKAIILGDIIASPVGVSEPEWVFAFDADPQQAIATRKAVLDRIEAEGMTLAQCHLPAPGFGRIVRLEGKRYFQAL
jgi:glyoxylase-like metal-dependent hydrolase (beta-lactamase superfamily II)